MARLTESHAVIGIKPRAAVGQLGDVMNLGGHSKPPMFTAIVAEGIFR